jgi:TonB family protein
MVVEVMPMFPGGEEARMNYLQSTIVYPESARKAGKQGTVYVQFIIEKDGQVFNPKVLRGFDADCDAEALRVIEGMPNWDPGLQRGKPVRVQFNMPIKFTLGNDEKNVDKDAPPSPPKSEKELKVSKPGTPPPPPPKNEKK